MAINNELHNLLSLFSSRELAYLAWITILICCIIVIPKFRSLSTGILQALFNRKFIIIYLLTIGYYLLAIYILRKYGFWDTSLLKDTIFWIVLCSSVLMFEISRDKEPIIFLKNSIKDSVKITVFLSFVMNFETFNFWLEFIAIPILLFLVIMHTALESKKEHTDVRKILEYSGVIASWALLIYILYFTINNYNQYLNFQTLKEFALPIILTLLFIPFLALLNLYVQYEQIAISLQRKLKNKKQYYKMLLSCLIFFNFNIKGAIRWCNDFVYLEPNEGLWVSMRKIRAQQIEENILPKHPELEGWTPSEAKQFLTQHNLIIKKYDSNLGKVWEGKSKDLKLDDDFMSGTYNYSIKGSKYIVEYLTLHFTCYERTRLNDLYRFLVILNDLYYAIEYEETPQKIIDYIFKYEDTEHDTPDTNISVYFVKWQNEKKGYDLWVTFKYKSLNKVRL